MIITDEQIKRFQFLWKRDFKEDIDKKIAREELLHFVNLVGMTYKPIKKSDLEKYDNQNITKKERSDYKNYSKKC